MNEVEIEKLRTQLGSLTPEERKLMKARILGYHSKLPPTIDEFIDSDYYMGKSWRKMLYPYWRQLLRELYPDEISTSNTMVVLSSALGTGKTTFTIVCAAYTLCRLMHLKDLSYSGINDESKPIILLFNHTSADKAHQECVGPLRDAMKLSMFFSNKEYPYPHKYCLASDSLRSNKAVGTNLIYASFSEVNFVNASKMKARMNTIINRYTNRFMKFDGYLGNIILDSSPSGTDSLVESFLKTTPFDIKIVRVSVWDVKGFLGGYSEEKFMVYAGDATHKPFIVDESNPLPDTYDPDKVVMVPQNLYKVYKNDVVLALQDTAGLAISITGKFIRNRDSVYEAFTMQYNYQDKIVVDLFDEDDSIISYFPNITEILPKSRRIAIHIDLGITGDICGLAAGYYDGEYVNNKELKITKPKIKVPLVIGIGRKKNQETCITKITEFIIWMSTIFEISVTMDTFQSRNMYQDLLRAKVKSAMLSVDRTADPYNYLKMLMYEGLLKGPKNEIVIEEITQLKVTKNKIDHPKEGSKDRADAVCGVCYNIYKNISWFSALPKALRIMAAQEMMADLYGKDHAKEDLNKKLNSLMDYSEDEDDEFDS